MKIPIPKYLIVSLYSLMIMCTSAFLTVLGLYYLHSLQPPTHDTAPAVTSSSPPLTTRLFTPWGAEPNDAKPSGAALPGWNQSGWKRVFADDFDTSLRPEWSAYDGQYGDSPHSYALASHVFTGGDVLHVRGALDNPNGWYNGGACLCNKATNYDWLNSEDALVTFRWRVVNTDLVSVVKPKYAFLRWPQSEQWPQDGEEDFLEGYLDKSAGFEFTSHAADGAGEDRSAYWSSVPQYDPTQWHTVTYARKAYEAALSIDDKLVVRHTGSEADMPLSPKHIVFQQVCDRLSACPTAGTSDIQIDWVAVYIPK